MNKKRLIYQHLMLQLILQVFDNSDNEFSSNGCNSTSLTATFLVELNFLWFFSFQIVNFKSKSIFTCFTAEAD